MQPTCLFRNSHLIDLAIKKLVHKKMDCLISVETVNSTMHPDYILKEYKKSGFLKSKKSLSRFTRQKISKYYNCTSFIAISSYKKFIKTKKIINPPILPFFIKNPIYSLDINEKLDLIIHKLLYKYFNKLK